MNSIAENLFGRWRTMFWPIHKGELKKFLPMLAIYTLIVFNYSILKPAKDALLITAPFSGAMAIPYIKVWAVLPMAFLSTLIFTRLSNRFSREKVFYIIMASFLSFFFLFAFFLYPMREILHPHAFADQIQQMLPIGFQGLIAVFRNWTFSLFYIMSELWGTLIMTVLFWGFANEVSSISEAKRFYAILGVGANIATVFAGQAGVFLSGEFLNSGKLFVGQDRWEQSLVLICSAILISGMITVVLYRKLCHNVFKKEIVNSKPMGDSQGSDIKMGIRKNFNYLANSKYLICIAVIVITYNMSLNMIEVLWKEQVSLLYPHPADFNMYMGKVMTYIGITSTLFALFICGQVIRRFGWTTAAYLTPMLMLLTGILFFSFLLFKDIGIMGTAAAFFGTTPLIMCAFFGSLQNCFARAGKFTFFDVTKEMAFIPLSAECKLKGKAAIDGVGSRLGKSGGSFFHQILLMVFGSVAMSTPFVAGILLLTILAWILAVRSLGKQFNTLTGETPSPTRTSETPLTVTG